MTVCSARLSCRSPPRLSRCRVVWPLEAGIGAVPARRAKACFGADATLVRPGDDQLGSDDRADAGLVEQLRCKRTDVRKDLLLELVGFAGCRLDPMGEAAQHEPCRELVWA